MDHTGFLHQYLDVARPYLDQYGYAAVFGGVLLEDFGLPVPGETLLIAGALLAAQGALNIVWLLALGCLGAIIGDNIGYALGRFGGRRLVLRHGRRVGVREEHVARVERFFERYGGGIVVVARFFEILRQLNGIVAGIGGMPWWEFLVYNTIGAGLWVGAWGFGVYRLGHHMEGVFQLVRRAEPYAIALGAAGLCILVFYLFWRRR